MKSLRNMLSSITVRLRIVLLTVVLLVVAQPIIVYFATGKIVDQQEQSSNKLIRTEFEEARLITKINKIAADGRNIPELETAEELQTAAAALVTDIDALSQVFAGSDHTDQGLIYSDDVKRSLANYKSLLGDAAEIQASRFVIEAALAAKLQVAKNAVSEMVQLLDSVTITRKIEQDRNINALEFADGAEAISKVRRTFSELLTLNNISSTLEAERFFLSSIERDLNVLRPQRIRARSRLQAQNLALQIARLPKGETQSNLAALAFNMSNVMFSSEGVFDQVELLQTVQNQSDGLLEEQRDLTNRLLGLTHTVTESAQNELVASSKKSSDVVRQTRLSILLITALAGLLIIGVILLVVERQFNRRIALLTRRVLSIAGGKADPGAPVHGDDELSAMGDALEVFKRNAAELREANLSLEQSNAEIQQLGARLETILNTTTSGIIAFDAKGQIILANLPARRFLGGVASEEPFQRPSQIKFLDRENLAPLEASSDPINRVLAGQILNHEIALMDRAGGGDGRYVRLTSNRVEDKNSIVRTVLAIDDVSEAEQNRQQIERASRLDALGQLTGGIAHDFNNLLATIQYSVQLAADSADQSKRQDYARIALESVERGAQLSTRLLTFAKRQPGAAKSLKVEGLMADFKDLIEPTIEETLSVSFRIDDPGMSVYCDGAQLENALLNLVLNARDAILRAGKGTEITIAVRSVSGLTSPSEDREPDPDRHFTSALEGELRVQAEGETDHSYRYVEFSVTDNGPGMTDEVKRRALDPFFTTKSTNSGTGLGLSMVYGFVQQSGGEIRIYTEPGYGTTMSMILPRGSSDDTREEPMLQQTIVSGQGQRILIVEDELHLRDAMEDLIASFGYEVSSAHSGQDAMDMMAEGLEFDVLITDIVMPGGVSGFELAADIRAVRPDVPVIYMSGYAAYSDKEMGGVIAPLLQKPCSPLVLSQHLAEALAAFAKA